MPAMAAGREKLISLVDTAFSRIEEDAPDDAVVGVAVLVVEVRMRDPDQTAIFEFSTDRREWVQRAILSEAVDIVGVMDGATDA
jgi:hypothetical protein